MKSISNNNTYPQVCLAAAEDDNIFDRFKTIPQYTEILEHTAPETGAGYLEVIKRDNPQLLEDKYITKFKENDIYGGSSKHLYQDIEIAPSTLRYIKVLSDLIKFFGNLDGFKIAEVGGGYGGQCKIINDFFKIESYHIVDLPDVNKLSKKYLDKLNVKNVRFSSVEDLVIAKYDLFISNYAYSELDSNLQDIYKTNIIDTSKNGYMTCNFISDIFMNPSEFYSREKLIGLKDKVEIHNEEPLTHPNNFILTWKNTP